MKQKIIITAIIALVIVGTIVSNLSQGRNVKVVDAVVLGRKIIDTSIIASGTLKHTEEVRLTSREIGNVQRIHVNEGDTVEKGQLVLEIDNEDHLAFVEQSEAAVRLAEIAIDRSQIRVEDLHNQMQRSKALFEKNLLDEVSFEKLSNELSLAINEFNANIEALNQRRSQLEQAKIRLSKTKIYTPISGVVTSLDIKEGETAITGTTNIVGSSLMTVANPDSIQTEVFVDEADVASVVVGQRASVVAIAYPNKPVQGKVSSVAVSAKKEQGRQGLSFAVSIDLDPTDDVELRPGMSCRAEIFIHEQQNVIAVPIKAIVVEETNNLNEYQYSVFAVRDGRAKRVLVELGISDDAFQEITHGLTVGDQIIIGPEASLQGLNDNDELDVRLNDDQLPG